MTTADLALIERYVRKNFAEIQRTALNTAACLATLKMLLVEKGVFTEKEFDATEARMLAVMDQQLRDNPGVIRNEDP